MTHFRVIPLDEGAYNGRGHCLRDDANRPHSGRWDAEQQLFTYSDGTPIRETIVAYNARVPGNPPEIERTARYAD
ncbi:hypothetical protein [Novosphingobium guangzhouense]|uniref:Uncharacterized protein n=1 Tax=Novosphingobium guangzhouense TaxID=1850347 RepID=A0A2K2FUN9_9SPHN|nr:hypothetical protein [Novosphingobium guangzhouense]PNU02492.1 hypothetical protein A8V01_08910 [Novosphingobium guangzhouense]